MCSFFRYPAVVQHDDVVSVAHGTESVSNDHYSLVLEQPVEVLHYSFLVVRVERVRSLVEEQELRVLVRDSSYEDPLLLSGAEAVTVRSYLGVVSHSPSP